MRTIVCTIMLAAGLVSEASAAGTAWSDAPLVLAQADCGGAARRAARQTGGEVLAARPDGRGGCEVTLLVPQDGGRPRRVVVNVPA